ncbi:TlpA family protein disulfide reductase [Bdellovibrio bacteriovorus]|uniref:TlpA disulfide reductase family protein n=1 Tax=Bdellovibrio bacteriovorus TaxID=959 RepID=UPI0021CE6BDC|nr:TlpA disulfide reductase family protein [Bdellovibrio bacteriovorus]UXR63360.1 TlpA family protein disulfide reductase [Bdellovibrio bacteriovorus]
MKAFALTLSLLLICLQGFAKNPVPEVEFRKLPAVKLNTHSISSIKDLQGKVVLVDFWASWCSPCKEALPHYGKLYEKYKDKGLLVIGINEDDDIAERDAFLKTMPLKFPLFFDQDKSAVADFQVKALPTLYVFDKKLKPVAMHRGFDAKDTQALEKQILDLLK